MKQLLFLLLAAGIISTSVSAQTTLGLRAGSLTSSYWKTKDAYSGNRLLNRVQIGALVEFPITNALSLRAEMNYAPKGDAWYFDYESGYREEIRDVYHYLEIPVMAKYKFSTGTSLEPYMLGGLYVAQALANRYSEGGEVYDLKFTKGDFGMHLGGGVALPLGPGRLFAELRFSQGFKNIDAFQSDETPTRLSSFGVSIGWAMEL